MDIFWTKKLLEQPRAIEANPIANFVIGNWGFMGMVIFKLTIVAVVCIIAQIVAVKRIKTARALLIFGTVLVGGVVIYSWWLFYTKFYLG